MQEDKLIAATPPPVVTPPGPKQPPPEGATIVEIRKGGPKPEPSKPPQPLPNSKPR